MSGCFFLKHGVNKYNYVNSPVFILRLLQKKHLMTFSSTVLLSQHEAIRLNCSKSIVMLMPIIFSQRIINVWNSLPLEIVDLD